MYHREMMDFCTGTWAGSHRSDTLAQIQVIDYYTGAVERWIITLVLLNILFLCHQNVKKIGKTTMST